MMKNYKVNKSDLNDLQKIVDKKYEKYGIGTYKVKAKAYDRCKISKETNTYIEFEKTDDTYASWIAIVVEAPDTTDVEILENIYF